MYTGGSMNERNAMQILQTFLSGYELCYFVERGPKGDRYIDMFTDWIHAKTGAPQGPFRLGPILDECNDNHLHALKRFFEYLEIFDREVPFSESYAGRMRT